MAYFANGTDGEIFLTGECANCANREARSFTCTIYDVHLLYNRDQCEEDERGKAVEEILGMLIRDEPVPCTDGGTAFSKRCALFRPTPESPVVESAAHPVSGGELTEQGRERCRQTARAWPRIVDNLLAGDADAKVRIGEEENLVRRALLRSAGPPKGIAGTPGCYQCGCGEWLFANGYDLARNLHDSYSACRAALARAGEQDETAWLIERGTRESVTGYWWTGAGFSNDTALAVRFARKQDAEAVIERCRLEGCVATDHIWVNR